MLLLQPYMGTYFKTLNPQIRHWSCSINCLKRECDRKFNHLWRQLIKTRTSLISSSESLVRCINIFHKIYFWNIWSKYIYVNVTLHFCITELETVYILLFFLQFSRLLLVMLLILPAATMGLFHLHFNIEKLIIWCWSKVIHALIITGCLKQ